MILNNIPGFRTNTKWKKIIAIIGYLFILLMLIICFTGQLWYDKLLHELEILIFIAPIYIFATNVGNIRSKLPLIKGKKMLTKLIVISLYIFIFIMVVGLSLSEIHTFFSPREKVLLAQQQEEQKLIAETKKANNKADKKNQVAKRVEEERGKEEVRKKRADEKKAVEEAKKATEKAKELKDKEDKVVAEKAEFEAEQKSNEEQLKKIEAEKDTAAKVKLAAELKKQEEAKAAEEKVKVDAEKARLEAKRKEKERTQAKINAVANYKKECTYISYNSIARNPNNYLVKKVKYSGEVIQIAESGSSIILRISVEKDGYGYDYSKVVYVNFINKSGNNRILQNDIVSFYGEFTGIMTYRSILGASISIPSVNAQYIDILNQ